MRLVIVDTETGGLDPRRHALLEIGAVVLNAQLEEMCDFQVLVKPEPRLGIEESALKINRLTRHQLQQGADEGDAVLEFLRFVAAVASDEKVFLAGWNVAFDEAFLKEAVQRHSLKWPFSHRMLDVQAIWAFCMGWSFEGITAACEQVLGEAPKHRALEDAYATVRILRWLRGNRDILQDKLETKIVDKSTTNAPYANRVLADKILVTQKADWLELVTRDNDLFRTDRCGYWLRGVEHGPQGWLAWVDDEQYAHSHGQEPDRGAARLAWKAGRPLPEEWFALDAALAERAWEIGLKKYGEHWYDEGDSTTYDVVLQLALFGEVRYG